jgi:type IV pilus assembly protein PilA
MSTAKTEPTVKILKRGFTLVELMIVVAIVGVLAAIALVGYERYQRSAGAGEARAMLLSIRGAEDSYKSELLVYKGCGAVDSPSSYYPRPGDTVNSSKIGWGDGPGVVAATATCFHELNVKASGPVRFAYAVDANLPSVVMPSNSLPEASGNWPFGGVTVKEPWFVATALGYQASGGRTASAAGDSRSFLYTSSTQSEVTVVDDTR